MHHYKSKENVKWHNDINKLHTTSEETGVMQKLNIARKMFAPFATRKTSKHNQKTESHYMLLRARKQQTRQV